MEKDKEIETLKTLLLKKEEEIEKKEKEMRESCRELGKMEERLSPVAYTHLDVYKRQRIYLRRL